MEKVMSCAKNPVSAVEKLESRTLMSTTPVAPVDLSGQYVGSYNHILYEVDLRHSATVKTSYTGDLVVEGIDLKLTATEAANGVLTGTIIGVDGKPDKFTSTLKGKILTTKDVAGTTTLTKISSTPAPAPPTLYAGKGKEFSYSAPKGWIVSQGTGGILITSPDRTQQVGLIGGVSLGVFGSGTIVAAETKAGDKFLSRKSLKTGWISSSQYEQQEIDLYTFVYKGLTYATAQLVTTVADFAAGAYNPQTGTYSGETLTLIALITAPKAHYTVDSVTLGNMLANIRTTAPAAKTHALVATGNQSGLSGFYDPGVYGDWSDTGGFDYSSDPYLYDEQSSLAYSSAAFDDSCAAFDEYILS